MIKYISLFLLLTQLTFADQVVEEMSRGIATLGMDHNFAIVDLNLSKEELHLIDQLKANSIQEYSRFGHLELLKEELPSFLRSVGNEDEAVIQTATAIICRTVSQVKEATQKKSAWVCVRAFTPNQLFDMPRWHWDGYFFLKQAETKESVFKFASTLKGNHTLFYPIPLSMRKTFQEHENDREYLSQLLDPNQVVQTHLGQGAFFLVGDESTAAVHSEPKMDQARLFFSVIVGNETDIQELYERWH